MNRIPLSDEYDQDDIDAEGSALVLNEDDQYIDLTGIGISVRSFREIERLDYETRAQKRATPAAAHEKHRKSGC